MAVTKEAEFSPQGPPRSQSPHQINGSCKKEISVALNVFGTGQQTEGACSKISEKQKVSKTTDEMIGFMDDLTLSSPKGRSLSCSRSSCSKRSSSVSSNDSSYSSSISSSSTNWSRSRSRAKRICSRKSRGVFRGYSRSYSKRHSRSYSRSHSGSHNYRYRERSHFRYYRRHPSSHPKYRSRSRSPIRSYYHRCYSRSSKSRSRGYYGFGRTVCSEVYRRWRNCSRRRPSLDRKRQTEEKKGIEMTSVTSGITLSPNNIMPRPLALKSASLLCKNLVVSPAREEKKDCWPVDSC